MTPIAITQSTYTAATTHNDKTNQLIALLRALLLLALVLQFPLQAALYGGPATAFIGAAKVAYAQTTALNGAPHLLHLQQGVGAFTRQNLGGGVFKNTCAIATSAIANVGDLVAAENTALIDADGDRILDIVFGLDSGPQEIRVHKGDGLGGFAAAATATTPTIPTGWGAHMAGNVAASSTFAVDVTGDGIADWVSSLDTAGADSGIAVWPGAGNGTFATTPLVTTGLTTPTGWGGHFAGVSDNESTFLVDLTGDGILDWVSSLDNAGADSGIAVWPGLGGGSFATTPIVTTGLTTPTGWGGSFAGTSINEETFLLDLTGDGQADWVSSNDGVGGSSGIAVWPGVAGGTFSATPIITTGLTTPTFWGGHFTGHTGDETAFIMDLTGDGVADWIGVVDNVGADSGIAVWSGLGGGAFATTPTTTSNFAGGPLRTGTDVVQVTFLTDFFVPGAVVDASCGVTLDLALDSDGDGVPDYTEHGQNSDHNDPASYLDSDGDLVPDYVEGQQGSDPNNPTDYLDSDGDLVPDYVESVLDGTNPNDPASFKDSDNGGAPDYVEQLRFAPAGDPNNAADDLRDSDGDGVPDYIELLQGTDPSNPASYLDSDGDLVPDYVEQQQGSNPNDPASYQDSDGDLVPDYVESVLDSTNPNDKSDYLDSDGDLVPDYVESLLDGTNPNDPASFKDSDNGGVPDYVELYVRQPATDINNAADDNPDTTPPAPPTITTPATNSTTNDTTPTISGLAEPGSTVTVSEGGNPICTAQAHPTTGAWSCQPATPLSDGPHTITATATDPAGNQSQPSAPRPFTVDSSTPAPTITSPVAGGVTSDNTPTISGLAEPGSTVTVSEGGDPICTAQADPITGIWSCEPATPLSDGPHTLTATATDPAGNQSQPSAPQPFTVDTSTPGDTTPPAPPTITSPAAGSTTNDTTPTIAGLAEPGSTVTVSEGGNPVCTAQADPVTGVWSCEPGAPLSDGPHTITATATDAAGNQSQPSAPQPFTVDTSAPGDTTPPAPPTITSPAAGSTTDDDTPTISGLAEPGSTVTVSEGGNPICTAQADPVTGIWSCEPATPLAPGPHTITATATDPAGNQSQPTNHPFTVGAPPPTDTTPPAPPTITSPADGATTSDNTPIISGLAEPGSTVTVSEGGVPLCTAQADPITGLWSCEPATPLTDGPHTITATATDAAGNQSQPTMQSFVVDTSTPGDATPPAPPTITTPAANSVISDTMPLIAGLAEPGSMVVVSEGGTLICTAQADPVSGVWSCTPATPLSEGLHSIQATATDAAGNQSAVTDHPFTIELETPAVTSPFIWLPIIGRPDV
jgi:hypothetical protein